MSKAQWVDDRCNFSCRAELDLNSRGGGALSGNSALQILRLFGKSEPRCGENPGAHFSSVPWPSGLISLRV